MCESVVSVNTHKYYKLLTFTTYSSFGTKRNAVSKFNFLPYNGKRSKCFLLFLKVINKLIYHFLKQSENFLRLN